MKYKAYDVEDLVKDDFFRQWVLDPDDRSSFFWENLIIKYPEKCADIEQARTIVLFLRKSEGERKMSKSSKDRLWDKIEASNDEFDASQEDSGNEKVIPLHRQYESHRPDQAFRNKKRLAFAAVITLFLVTLAAFQYMELGAEPEIEEKWVVKSNPKGQKSKVYLPDGSWVTLNAESEISFKENFTGERREIKLRGEAFFDVAKNPNKPFIVYSGEVSTTALGTSFNISTDSEQDIKVSLVTGSVQVLTEASKASMFLQPGEQAVFELDSKEMMKGRFSSREVLAWKEGIILFKKASKAEVFNRLSKWYGVDFEFINTAQRGSDWVYSGEYNQISLEEVLTGLGYTHDFTFSLEGNRVIIDYRK
ncbi:MAG: FecR domain-containing protein [Cyclobacteriaceae bacterium]|nr:FecR domain-containing protein [Cyclobacteriaceae bacterium HetDA_MAG_MS6]